MDMDILMDQHTAMDMDMGILMDTDMDILMDVVMDTVHLICVDIMGMDMDITDMDMVILKAIHTGLIEVD